MCSATIWRFSSPALNQFHRVLKPSGSLYFHVDQREVHYCKVLLDAIFGRACFLNESSGPTTTAADRAALADQARQHPGLRQRRAALFLRPRRGRAHPVHGPGLVGADKAARGKRPTDTWWHTIVPPGGRERTGYPNPEAARHLATDRADVIATRRHGGRLFRRQRHDRRRLRRDLADRSCWSTRAPTPCRS